MKCGQSRPNSKLSTVPVTAPTAKVTAIAFDQRRASSHRVLVAASCRPDVVGDQDRRRQGDAEAGEDDVEAERERHLLARGEQVRLPTPPAGAASSEGMREPTPRAWRWR